MDATQATTTSRQKNNILLDLCALALRSGHAYFLCIVPILTDDSRGESRGLCNTGKDDIPAAFRDMCELAARRTLLQSQGLLDPKHIVSYHIQVSYVLYFLYKSIPSELSVLECVRACVIHFQIRARIAHAQKGTRDALANSCAHCACPKRLSQCTINFMHASRMCKKARAMHLQIRVRIAHA